jgi:hypothetical protein
MIPEGSQATIYLSKRHMLLGTKREFVRGSGHLIGTGPLIHVHPGAGKHEAPAEHRRFSLWPRTSASNGPGHSSNLNCICHFVRVGSEKWPDDPMRCVLSDLGAERRCSPASRAVEPAGSARAPRRNEGGTVGKFLTLSAVKSLDNKGGRDKPMLAKVVTVEVSPATPKSSLWPCSSARRDWPSAIARACTRLTLEGSRPTRSGATTPVAPASTAAESPTTVPVTVLHGNGAAEASK